MIPKFFGIPPDVVRLNIWADLKPVEAKLYAVFWHESERYRTRELSRSDAELGRLAGVSTRAIRDARTKLHERGLVQCSGEPGSPYTYQLCDPATRQPWPGNPKQRVAYEKKGTQLEPNDKSEAEPVRAAKPAIGQTDSPKQDREIEKHGVRVEF